MKYLSTLILLVLLPSFLFAQKTKTKLIKYYKSEVTKQEYQVLRKNKNIKHGYYKSFYKNGQIKESGTYENNRKAGKWIKLNSQGKNKRVIIYKNGRKKTDKRVGIWEDVFEHGTVIKRYDYDNNKKLKTIILLKVEYPTSARDKGISGIVKVKIQLTDNCEIQQLTIIHSLSKACDEVALKVIKKVIDLQKKYDIEGCKDVEPIIPVHFQLE